MGEKQWAGLVFDVVIIASVTLAVIFGGFDRSLYLAVVGPLVGARVLAMRVGNPPGSGGSAAIALILAVGALLFHHRHE